MSLVLRRKADGTLVLNDPKKGLPDEHAFPSSMITKLALSGNITMSEDQKEVTLTFGKVKGTFEVAHSPDENPDPGQPDAWVLRKKEAK